MLEKRFARLSLETIQLNLGRVCNLSCRHCHHESGPARREAMSSETAEKILAALPSLNVGRLELTGGSPELNPNFDMMVERACELGIDVAVRTNLVVACETGFEYLPEFFRDNRVEVIGSLPCYMEVNVDRQRGVGTFRKSIEVLKTLNSLGYGQPETDLALHLVYNPGGAFLPGAQAALEESFRERLSEYGVRFNALFAMANMPIGRFRTSLNSAGGLDSYRDTLVSTADPENWEAVMCRRLAAVDWDGTLFDCDFNLALRLGMTGGPVKLWDISVDGLVGRKISVGEHCYGCVAGEGSSCRGTLVSV